MFDIDSGHPWFAVTGGLVFGVTNSLHCVGMCGPLVAATHGGIGGGAGYHAARIFGYATVGAIAGGIGDAVGVDSIRPGGATFALTLAAAMLLGAFGISTHIGRIGWLDRIVSRISAAARQLPPTSRGIALGAVTPLLPCGLLYAAVAVAIAAGSATGGLAVMAGFGLGAVPALAFAQWNFERVRNRFGVAGTRRLARASIIVAAAALIWRAGCELAQGPVACCASAG